jgi:hypothetical protein
MGPQETMHETSDCTEQILTYGLLQVTRYVSTRESSKFLVQLNKE